MAHFGRKSPLLLQRTSSTLPSAARFPSQTALMCVSPIVILYVV